jgi:hypothetical protein
MFAIRRSWFFMALVAIALLVAACDNTTPTAIPPANTPLAGKNTPEVVPPTNTISKPGANPRTPALSYIFNVTLIGLDGQSSVFRSASDWAVELPTGLSIVATSPGLTQALNFKRFDVLAGPLGEYQLHIELPPYKPRDQTVTLVTNTQMVTVPMSMDPLNTEHLVQLNRSFFNYETGQRVMTPTVMQIGNQAFTEELPPLGVRSKAPLRLMVGTAADQPQQVYLDNTGETRFTLPGSKLAYDGFAFSPDLQRVLYTQNDDLWLATADWDTGQLLEARQVTNVGVFPSAGSGHIYWHPDGKHILVDRTDVYQVDLESGETVEAKIGWKDLFTRRMSPDGRTVVGSSDADKGTYLYDIAANTKTLLQGVGTSSDYVWLDNNRLALRINYHLWVVNRDGSGLRELENTKLNHIEGWSAHFVMDDFGHLVNVETGNVTDQPAGIERFDWINDDTLLLSREQGGEATLEDRGTWLFKPQDGQLVKITPYPYSSALLLKDENLALFIANNNVWRVNLDGSGLTQLTQDGEAYGDLQKIIHWDF